MLILDNVDVFYGKLQALHQISLEVKEGEIVTIIGANGAGKTTLMRAIMGLKSVSAGKIYFYNRDITKDPPWFRTELGIAYIPEGRRVFPNLTVEENLKIGCYRIKDKQAIKRSFNKVYEIFPRLEERKYQFAKTLSGGEQQMLAIGRAMMSNPKLLLVDEVSMGLMPIMVSKAMEVLQKMRHEGTTILLVEQNAKKALSIADRGYILETGRIVMQDSAQALQRNPEVKRAYLGG